jgi:hypothetical protein
MLFFLTLFPYNYISKLTEFPLRCGCATSHILTLSGHSHALVTVAPENEPLLGLPAGEETLSLGYGLGRRCDEKTPSHCQE